jgi:sulfatase modifying factor 1
MLKPVAWGRAALTGAALLVCAGACDSVLGIEEPQDRPTDGGEAGEPPSVAGTKNMGGSSGLTTPEGGAAGTPEITVVGEAGGGGGGAPPMPQCEVDDVRCGGDGEKTPEVCDETGHWVQNEVECQEFCNAGTCVACLAGDEARCTPCEEGDADCNPRQRQQCIGGAWQNEGNDCDHYCTDGSCITPHSCNGAESRGICKDSESCCKSLFVPGGSFKRDYDKGEYFSDDGFPAQISPFFLDKFEVTVGRMRAFVDVYPNHGLAEGAGKAPHITNDVGWTTAYDLEGGAEALLEALHCNDGTWSDELGTNDQLPINCVPFKIAYTFCVWDGGRLPTNAEWNFAAQGGGEQRVYPWKAPIEGPAISDTYATYEPAVGPSIVGFTPKGNGRWGHADLAGNVYEWVMDYYQEEYSRECNDCLNTDTSGERILRGGSYMSTGEGLSAAYRASGDPNQTISQIGFRCARDIK